MTCLYVADGRYDVVVMVNNVMRLADVTSVIASWPIIIARLVPELAEEFR